MYRVWQGLGVLSLITVTVLTGCGSGGTRMISNVGGEVVRGELDLTEYASGTPDEEYQIGHGDEFDITFLHNSEYNLSDVRVRPDGRISLPHAGEVVVVGLTPLELDSLVTEKYGTILRSPEVAVIMKDFAESVVYVLGEVEAPGAYPIDRSITLLGALAKSRGIGDKAKRSGVLVIRRIDYDRIVGMQFDVNELLEEGRFDLDIPLEPNDIVFVPKSALHKAEEFASVVYDILEKPADLYLKGWQVTQVKWLYEFYRVTGQGR